jgi:hypothetical protein
MWTNLIVCLFLIVLAGNALAAESAPAYFFRRCASIAAAAAAADPACANYVYGVLNVLPFDKSDAALRRSTCFPSVVSPSQATALVDNYWRTHPERRGAGAGIVRVQAFNAAFPCKH